VDIRDWEQTALTGQLLSRVFCRRGSRCVAVVHGARDRPWSSSGPGVGFDTVDRAAGDSRNLRLQMMAVPFSSYVSIRPTSVTSMDCHSPAAAGHALARRK